MATTTPEGVRIVARHMNITTPVPSSFVSSPAMQLAFLDYDAGIATAETLRLLFEYFIEYGIMWRVTITPPPSFQPTSKTIDNVMLFFLNFGLDPL